MDILNWKGKISIYPPLNEKEIEYFKEANSRLAFDFRYFRVEAEEFYEDVLEIFPHAAEEDSLNLYYLLMETDVREKPFKISDDGSYIYVENGHPYGYMPNNLFNVCSVFLPNERLLQLMFKGDLDFLVPHKLEGEVCGYMDGLFKEGYLIENNVIYEILTVEESKSFKKTVNHTEKILLEYKWTKKVMDDLNVLRERDLLEKKILKESKKINQVKI